MFHPSDIVLIGLTTVAATIDARCRRIPNWLNAGIALVGIGAYLSGHGITWMALGMSLLGLLCGFVLLFPAFAIGAMGGGDVKLLAAVGAWTGPLGILIVLLAATVAGAVIALIQAASSGKLAPLLHNSGLLVLNLAHVRSVGVEHIEQTGKAFRSIDRPLPYAVAMLAGVIVWCAWF